MDDMKSTIQGIASKGRNGDNMLVHMSPEEVQGIASLGMVSINPDTGLPEMFKFKDFLKIAVPIALTAMAPAAGAAAASKATTMNPGFLKTAMTFLGKSAGQSLLTGAAQFAGQRLVGTGEKDALNAGIMAGATYGAASAAQKAFAPSPEKTAVANAKIEAERARQQQFINQMSPDQVNLSRPQRFQSDAFGTASATATQRPVGITSVIEQYPELSKNYGLREGMSQAELDATRNYAQAELEAMQAPTDKFRIPGLGEVDKKDLYSGLGAGAVGAMSVPPEEIEEERKRREIAMAQPYSTPATFPGAGYGSREYSYFGPNYGMYAKEGGHIKQMQEGGAVDTTTGTDIIPPSTPSAFSGDLMAFAPGIVGGANYGMGAMPGGIDSSEFNYNVAPNMGGYDYRSFVPEDARGQGIASAGTGMGTGEKVTGSPNVIADAKKTTKSAGVGSFKPYLKWTPYSKIGKANNVPGASGRMFRDRVIGYGADGTPVYERQTKFTAVGSSPMWMIPDKVKYGTMKIPGMQEGGITSLPQTEGQVEGNGDGMSDEVYGDIENQQEVALSKDEFIVPADVVSGLGNGSSNAGASKLYEMMARVRKARTGKETQPEEIRAEEFMPA